MPGDGILAKVAAGLRRKLSWSSVMLTEYERSGRYFGMVPSQDASARSNWLGHITREGPSVVRHVVVEAAWQGIRRSARLRAFSERVRRADPARKKIALVATAHYRWP